MKDILTVIAGILYMIGFFFYIIDMQTGSVFEEKNYDHHLLGPTATKELVFVAEELHFTTYR